MDENAVRVIITFALIFVRLMGFFLLVPFFSSMLIPAVVKTGLGFFVTLLFYPMLAGESLLIDTNPLALVLVLAAEFLTGFLMGLSLQFTFASIQLAGEFIDRRMGFLLANVLDPQTGEQAPLAGQLKMFLATLLFLFLQGHHVVLQGLYSSYRMLGLGQQMSITASAPVMVRIAGDLFLLGFQMALPVIAALFIVDAVFGFLARTIPQINIFVVGLPTKVMVGLFIIYLALPTFAVYFNSFFRDMMEKFHYFLRTLGG